MYSLVQSLKLTFYIHISFVEINQYDIKLSYNFNSSYILNFVVSYNTIVVNLNQGFRKLAKWPLLGPLQILRGPRAAKEPEYGP